MQLLSCFLCVTVGFYYLFVLQDIARLTCFINLYEVLIYNAACTDIEVTHFRVTHLPVRQTYIFATGQQLCMWTGCVKQVKIWSWCIKYHITFVMFADSPAVENHQ